MREKLMIKEVLQRKKKNLIMGVIIKNYVIMQLDKKSDLGLCSVSFFSACLAILMTFIYFWLGTTHERVLRSPNDRAFTP